MPHPNIVILMADQMTAALTGAYGHPTVRTPNLDRLAAAGVRFDAAYSPCPLCTPARTAMMSGRYVSRTRTYDNGAVLSSDVPTWAHHLRAAGYEVVAAGKMHFVGADQLHGFERRLTPDIYPADFSWTPQPLEPCDGADDTTHRKALAARQAGPCDGSEQIDYDENVHARSLEYLRGRADGDRPFCLLVSYSHPHPPYLCPRWFWEMYEDVEIDLPAMTGVARDRQGSMEKWLHSFQGFSPADAADAAMLRRLHRAYYGMVSYVDEKVGQVLAAVEAAGVRDSTAVFFTSDHGDMLGQRRQVQKRLFYEWSARVPLIGSFPGRWPEGVTASAPVNLIDLFPTLTDLTGAPAPIDVDGQSLLPLLTGQAPPHEDRITFSEYHGESVRTCCFMARRGRFKYVYVHGHERQLFDVEADPLEQTNLSADPAHAETEQNLHAAVVERFDVEAIAEDMFRSRAERVLMREAMDSGTPTRWDYRP
ncbi:MAG: choline-sulfatase [Planctomycetota bacterium]